jgi:AbiV family abortive infection protein
MKPNLGQYFGALSSAKIAEGMNVAQKNAQRLLDDARLLFDNGRYPSAAAWAILSIEESGKRPILRELALAHNEKELREAWRSYRSHTKKSALWPVLEMFSKGARRADDFGGLFDPNAEHPYILDQLKQVGIYTDCLGKAHWSVPEQVIERDLATMLLKTAEILAHGREIQAEEIDLWIQHMQPSWKSSKESMEKALFEWEKALRSRGLAESSGRLEQFFKEGITPPPGPKGKQ